MRKSNEANSSMVYKINKDMIISIALKNPSISCICNSRCIPSNNRKEVLRSNILPLIVNNTAIVHVNSSAFYIGLIEELAWERVPAISSYIII
jgi:hypothetical protein